MKVMTVMGKSSVYNIIFKSMSKYTWLYYTLHVYVGLLMCFILLGVREVGSITCIVISLFGRPCFWSNEPYTCKSANEQHVVIVEGIQTAKPNTIRLGKYVSFLS